MSCPSFFRERYLLALLSLSTFLMQATAFDNSRYDNVAVYWGQNSYGAANAGNTANYQKTLSYYCQDDAIDVFPMAFLNVFFGTGGLPSINLANTCNPTDNATFPGTTLPDCASLADDIKACQKKGKIVTLSLGGATGSVGFTDDSQASDFADQIWNLFLGGSSETRPFGDAILDGIDLDIEGGGSTGYAAFINRIRSHTDKKYYITAAPQCVFPDAALGGVLNAAEFDAIYVQFYNNACGLQNFDLAQDWNFGTWDNWARQTSPNKDVKVYIGAPASTSASGTGYQDIATLSKIAVQMRKSFPSFGGVMLWDASQADANSRYDKAIKDALVAAGGTSFTYPACSAPAYASGTSYQSGSQVSYGGYIWQAKFYASTTPNNDPNGEWSAISVCSDDGSGSSSASSSTKPTTSSSSSTSSSTTATSTSISTTTTKSSSSSPSTSSSSTMSGTSSSTSPTTTGGCAGIATWSTGMAYTSGQKVTYGNHLWTAQYWTENDVPGGTAGSWTDEGPCSASFKFKAARNPSMAQATPPPIPRTKPLNSRLFRDI